MRHIASLIILLAFSNLLIGQENFEEVALSHAKAMTKALNEKNYVGFADYLTPEQYPFEDKTKLYETWEKVLSNDSSICSNITLERFGIFDNTQQAYFSCKYGDNNTSFLGISVDTGKSWHFTQLIREFNYEQIKKMMIHHLDSSFANLDPNYNKRIFYKIGEQISPFEYEDINGNLLKSESLKGKIIVLNFWNTSCAPCIKEMPQLNKLVEKMKDKNIVFIALASNDNTQSLKNNFLTKHEFLYQIVTIKGDDYQISALPTHIIIDRDQKVVDRFTGASEENLMKLELLLDEL